MRDHTQESPLFPPGRILLSLQILKRELDYTQLVIRHLTGDWGNISPQNAAQNLAALHQGKHIRSQYETEDADGFPATVVIMTAADRSVTVIHVLGESPFNHPLN